MVQGKRVRDFAMCITVSLCRNQVLSTQCDEQ